MRIVFMGSAELSCKSMEALLAESDIEIGLILTQPDRPKGRNLKIASCPARALAVERGIEVISPADPNAPDVVERLREVGADCFVVVAYGRILSPELIEIPSKGCINVHTSLLPKYRGAAPIQWAVANGDSETGVTTMYIDEKMDQGDIVYQEGEPIHSSDTGGSLHDRLADRGARLLVRTLKDIAVDGAPRIPQDHSHASLAPKLSKQQGRIDWAEECDVTCNRIRGFNPWPVCWFRSGDALAKKVDCVVRVYSARRVDGAGKPGTVLRSSREGIDVASGAGAIRIEELQAEGGKRMVAEEFLRGHYVEAGKVFS